MDITIICSVEGCTRPARARGWCTTHYSRHRRTGRLDVTRSVGPESEASRFWAKVDKNGPVPTWAPFLGPCWIWTAGLQGGGYGQFNGGSRIDNSRRKCIAHVYTYEALVGPVPDGLELDHLCRVRKCCNPAHLEAVTHAENMHRGLTICAENAAKVRCPDGHPYDDENTYVHQGHRHCRECMRAANRRYKAKINRRPEQQGAI